MTDEKTDDRHIDFNSQYGKLHWQKKARLIYVELKSFSEFGIDFHAYDSESLYLFEDTYLGRYILLVFLGENNIPFTTIRKDDEAFKFQEYVWSLQKQFEIRVVR